MKKVPYSLRDGLPKGRLARRMACSLPSSSSITFSAMCELVGFTSSSISMSSYLVRPMTFSCSATGSAFQAAMSWMYFCTMT